MSRTHRLNIFIVAMMLAASLVQCQTDVAKMGKSCKLDAQCSPPYIVCKKNICERKDLFPMTGAEIGAIFVLLILVMLAIIVSLSGGLIIVPIMILMIGFSAKQAVVLANAIVLLTSGTKYVMSLFKVNPDFKFKTIVDYNAAIAMIPNITLFSTIGGIVSAMIPDVLILFSLISMLIMSMTSAVFQVKNQLKLRKMQQIKQSKPAITEPEDAPPQSADRLLSGSQDSKVKKADLLDTANIELNKLSELKKDNQTDLNCVNSESSSQKVDDKTPANSNDDSEAVKLQKKIEGMNYYWKKFSLILTVLVISILAGLFRGGAGLKSIIGIKKCAAADWIVLAINILLLGSLPIYSYFVIMKEQKHKKEINWNANPTEIFLTNKTFSMTVIYSAFAGFMSSITGLGGGVILTPFLAFLNYSPVTISWTINIMVFLSKIAAVLQGILSGQILYSYVLFYGCLIALLTVIAENTLLKVIKKMKSQVLIPIGIMVVLTISLCMNLYLGISEWVEKQKKGSSAWILYKYC